ncbi:Phage portal protein, lambda family [Polystyrenella longa]|uniref:Phage portal protein, lambda family n=1 Tax=Polystyrenella longa TaxID=2528007 RepID=A0A518CHB0_9PLAN|nr:phage portal protein [Polystyrenella longa]QDU78619.1 Phage portal protein, lambda family [Polystyrenella longa]
MLSFIKDRWRIAQLKAEYQRRVQENLLELVEANHSRPVADDSGEWMQVGKSKTGATESEQAATRDQVRKMVHENPHARNILRLMEVYVVGPELQLSHQPQLREGEQEDRELTRSATTLWKDFLSENQRHFSYREYAKRTWRDGETFLRQFDTEVWPPTVRFIDPEQIGATAELPDSEGIITQRHDVETPIYYLQVDANTGELLEQIPAAEVFHTRINVDSNQKRGESLFAPILACLSSFNRWVETELLARKLQASIVLWRKVQGSASAATNLAESAQTSSTRYGGDSVRRERFAPGTILTTSAGTDLQYLSPNTNFGDAVPLGRLLLLCTAAGAGLPEFMLTSDAANANYSSTMVAEGPAVKMFQSEQNFFANEFTRIWRWVMREAISQQLLPDDFLDRYRPSWNFPQLVNRDRSRERLADTHMVDHQILSRAEVARRDGVDPHTMQTEIDQETTRQAKKAA